MGRRDLSSLVSFPNFTSHVPYFKYLFILGVLWDFAVRKCESQYILSESDHGNILSLIPVSYAFSERTFVNFSCPVSGDPTFGLHEVLILHQFTAKIVQCEECDCSIY
jgi:hypothetical protein